MSSLALRQYRIRVPHSGEVPFAHNYLVRYDDDGNVASELHGLAYDRSRTSTRRSVTPATISEFKSIQTARAGCTCSRTCRPKCGQ